MAESPPIHAGKPALVPHPVIGGDALSFPLRPAPPSFWWIALRRFAHANSALSRPWDQPQDSRLIVECPQPDDLSTVIDAVNAVVAAANDAYARELEERGESAEHRRTEALAHEQAQAAIRHALDAHYAAEPTPVGATSDGA
jgi:hypothetical protein